MSPLSLKRSKPEPEPFYRNRVFIYGTGTAAAVTGIGLYARWAINEHTVFPGWLGKIIERVTTFVDEYAMLRAKKKSEWTNLDDVVPDTGSHYTEYTDKKD